MAAALPAAEPCSFATWTQYLGGVDSSQYSSLKQINKSNVKHLEIAWSYPTGDGRNYLFDPIVIDGIMYLLANHNSVVALDAATGKVLWKTALPAASEGVPAVYEIGGREYLAVCVAGGNGLMASRGTPDKPAPAPGSYIISALPKK